MRASIIPSGPIFTYFRSYGVIHVLRGRSFPNQSLCWFVREGGNVSVTARLERMATTNKDGQDGTPIVLSAAEVHLLKSAISGEE